MGHFRRSGDLWDRQYQAGDWTYMEKLDQSARYAAVINYIARLKPGGRILDVGCGTGILRRRLPAEAFASYHGIDISAKAVAAASDLRDARTRFSRADLRSFEADERYDVVVFNEVLYYLPRPIEELRRFARRFLAEDGIVVVSMHVAEHAVFDWGALDGDFRLLHGTRTQSMTSGKTWFCRALALNGEDSRRS